MRLWGFYTVCLNGCVNKGKEGYYPHSGSRGYLLLFWFDHSGFHKTPCVGFWKNFLIQLHDWRAQPAGQEPTWRLLHNEPLHLWQWCIHPSGVSSMLQTTFSMFNTQKQWTGSRKKPSLSCDSVRGQKIVSVMSLVCAKYLPYFIVLMISAWHYLLTF